MNKQTRKTATTTTDHTQKKDKKSDIKIIAIKSEKFNAKSSLKVTKLFRKIQLIHKPLQRRLLDSIMGLNSLEAEQQQQRHTATTTVFENFKSLQDIQVLHKPNCHMRDPERVERIINEFIRGGPERLQVVSDFDYTITKQHMEDGKSVLTSFGIFNACQSLPQAFKEESTKLFKKYRPIEIDPHMPIEEKVQHMVDWWVKSGALLVGFPFDHTEIDAIAYKYKDALRDHTHELFHKLNRSNIPVLVFSAGLGDSVISVLRQAEVLYPNVKVISNFLQYKDGLLHGFQVPIIHTFNKNETALDGSEYYDLVHTRDHIIVMGDSLGDADMANGVPSSSHIIKIGFLYDHVEQNLEKYKNAFDIVLVDDQTMDVPYTLLSLIEEFHSERSLPAQAIED